jgi:hypothetical protein
MNIEELARDQKLAEQEIARQVVDEKNKRIWELEKRVELLEGMLNRASTFQGVFPQPQPLPSVKTHPRRWSVR